MYSVPALRQGWRNICTKAVRIRPELFSSSQESHWMKDAYLGLELKFDVCLTKSEAAIDLTCRR